jgi:pyruvate,orthophosphate dikinase
MVFGNGGGTSGAGVGFTRDPATGEPSLYLDYAANAQGEDVVSGRAALGDVDPLALLPVGIDTALHELAQRLEREFQDVQEFEFTIEDGRLFVLQTRTAKRAPLAALRIAVELAETGVIGAAEARARVARLDPAQLVVTRIDGSDAAPLLATGIAASAGVASGRVVFDPERARARAACGESVILVRDEVATDDIAGIESAKGLLAARGARTSHAAVVARQLGKACIVGCGALAIDAPARACTLGDMRLAEGELVTLDAGSGRVYGGALRVVREPPAALLARLEALHG